MALGDNKTGLQTILETVNNLPESGGSSATEMATITFILDQTTIFSEEYEVGSEVVITPNGSSGIDYLGLTINDITPDLSSYESEDNIPILFQRLWDNQWYSIASTCDILSVKLVVPKNGYVFKGYINDM